MKILKILLASILFITVVEAAPFSVSTERDVKGVIFLNLAVVGPIEGDSFDIINSLLQDRQFSNTPVIISLHSPGGDANSMLEFLTLLREHRGKVITINEGKAYSAAAIIYALGDIKVARAGSVTLFHSVQFQSNETLNVETLTEMLRFARDWNQKIYDMLVDETGHTEQFIRSTYFIEGKEGNFLSFHKLSKFGLVDYRYNAFLDIFDHEGISGVVANVNN